MSNPKSAIMFSDVAGSTRLYDALGDKPAEKCISDCLQTMKNVVENHHGVVIKTIGDEVMSRFDSADAALHAAIEMQRDIKASGQTYHVPMAVRIGIHFGDVIHKDDDVYGDAVNVASRMASIAKAGQIITTADLVQELSSENVGKTQWFDKTKIKGKENELSLYLISWADQDETTIVSASDINKLNTATALMVIKYNDQEIMLTDAQDSGLLIIGRSSACGLIVNSNLASRSHANIEYRRNKFVLIDRSTNGTYVNMKNNENIFLRREELPLFDKGIISLGEKVNADNPLVISFEVLK